MISIYNLKPQFQKLLRPIAKFCNKVGISANMVTMFAMLSSVVFSTLPFFSDIGNLYWFLIPLFFFIRMALNAIDGIIAKEHYQQTSLGAFLNELGDIVSDSALILSFIYFIPNQYFSLVILTLLAALTEATGLCSKTINGIRSYKGPMGKSDRAFVLGILSLLIGLNYITQQYFICAIWLMCILSIWTVINRIKEGLQ